MIRNILIGCILLLPCFVGAVENVEGYGMSRWGMNLEQTILSEQGRAHAVLQPTQFGAYLGLAETNYIKIGDFYFQAIYQFQAGALRQVLLRAVQNFGQNINEVTLEGTEALLTRKYGKPNARNSKNSAVWYLQGTTIEITYLIDNDPTTPVNIRYFPSSETKLSIDNL